MSEEEVAWLKERVEWIRQKAQERHQAESPEDLADLLAGIEGFATSTLARYR